MQGTHGTLCEYVSPMGSQHLAKCLEAKPILKTRHCRGWGGIGVIPYWHGIDAWIGRGR